MKMTLVEIVAEVKKHTGGGLDLSGLTTLSDKAADALAKHTGGWLYLPYKSRNGITW